MSAWCHTCVCVNIIIVSVSAWCHTCAGVSIALYLCLCQACVFRHIWMIHEKHRSRTIFEENVFLLLMLYTHIYMYYLVWWFKCKFFPLKKRKILLLFPWLEIVRRFEVKNGKKVEQCWYNLLQMGVIVICSVFVEQVHQYKCRTCFGGATSYW